jgi:hypothetical protein
MATPDLANLLKKPRRPAAEIPSHAAASSEAAEPLTTPAENEIQVAAAPEDATSLQLESAATNGERKRRQPKSTAEAAVSIDPPSPLGRQYLRIKSIYLPRSLHQRLGEQAIARKTTRTALILTAINQTHSRLGSYLAAGSPSASRTGGDDLFDIPQDKKDTEPAVQTTIRVTDRQHQAIENLVEVLGANRSQLVAAALSLYLV